MPLSAGGLEPKTRDLLERKCSVYAVEGLKIDHAAMVLCLRPQGAEDKFISYPHLVGLPLS